MPSILSVENLTKKFGTFTAVDGVSFELGNGEILGFLGPNGAGKTTTLQMLLGVLTPTSGNVRYFGKDFVAHREEILDRVNFSSTYISLPGSLTVLESLTFAAFLYTVQDRKKRVAEVVELLELGSLTGRRVDRLSAGQQTRLNLAKAFLNAPDVLFLDEPTASLDPDVARAIRAILVRQREDFSVSILITSHNMEEVEELCDRVIFMSAGKIAADDTPKNLARSITIGHVELMVSAGADELLEYCVQKNLVCSMEGGFARISVPEKEISQFLQELGARRIVYDEISIAKPTLEDYFLQVARVPISEQRERYESP